MKLGGKARPTAASMEVTVNTSNINETISREHIGEEGFRKKPGQYVKRNITGGTEGWGVEQGCCCKRRSSKKHENEPRNLVIKHFNVYLWPTVSLQQRCSVRKGLKKRPFHVSVPKSPVSLPKEKRDRESIFVEWREPLPNYCGEGNRRGKSRAWRRLSRPMCLPKG